MSLAAVAAVSFAYSVLATRNAPTVAFYELPARAWEFAAGGLLAIRPLSSKSPNTRWAIACGFIGMTAIIGTGVMLKGGTGFPGWVALFPVCGTLAAIFAGTNAPRRGISAVLSTVPLQFVGGRSYSWYLWHWPFFVFAARIFPEPCGRW